MSLAPGRNLKTIFEIKIKELGSKGFLEWKNSEEGLQLICSAFSYDEKFCKNELERLRKLRSLESRLLWDEACEKSWDGGILKFGSPEHLAAAEEYCISRFVIPPHFIEVGKCTNCGFVATTKAATSCRWCLVVGQTMQEAWATSPQTD